jgi:predicted RNase H-like HicB family nuclease
MKKVALKVNIPISIIREGKAFVAYTTALDLSTAGKTRVEAEKRFFEAVNIFFEETIKRGTLDATLTELGWHKADRIWMPPMVISNETKPMTVYA